MEYVSYSHSFRVDYSENIAPKYPDVQGNQAGLEVVPNESPLYTLSRPSPPTHAALHPVDQKFELPADSRWDTEATERNTGGQTPEGDSEFGERRRILGLTVPVFWGVILAIVVILAVGIGGGVGGAISQRRSTSSTPSSPSESPKATPDPTTPANGPIPSDSGCPAIEGQTHTPYAVNGQPIPMEPGLEAQRFRQQCWTNWVSSTSPTTTSPTATHDILRIFVPTLENCMMTCAEYNSAYRAGLNSGAGVGGGYCVAVSIVKDEAGFCYLKNGTGTNDTMKRPEVYSSAVLITDTELGSSGT